MSDSSTDVIVAGGGLVGAVAALGIAGTGRSVLLIDRQRPQTQAGRMQVDIRNIACSPASQQLLDSVGGWSGLQAAPYRRMQIWEERGTAELTFDADDVGREELGWILENGPTVAQLWQRLDAEPLIEVRLGEIGGVEQHADRLSVRLATGCCEGRLLVGVDGARSTVRSLVKARLESRTTGQQALTTLVRTERGHEGVAYQRFLLDGPLALLPSRVADLSSVVWSQSPERAAERLALPEEVFCAELGRAMEHRLGRILEVDRRLVFPLAQHVVADFNPLPRVLLIGDAARVIHPLAGLGANVGFEDVRDLLARLECLPGSMDPGSKGIWRAFARKRRLRAQLMVAAMSGFKTAYAEGDPLRQWLRNGAVDWINNNRPLKQQIISEALGLGPLASSWSWR